MILIDANLLIYAVNRDAPQHVLAADWLQGVLSSTTPIGLPWSVLLAFLRITTHPNVMQHHLDTNDALAYIDAWLQQPFVTTLHPGEKHWLIMQQLLDKCGTAGNLSSDAHIAAIAIEHGYSLYSADNDFKRFNGLQHINPLAAQDVHEKAGNYL